MRFSGRASPSTMEEEEVLEEGGAAPREGVRLPSLSLTIYRWKGGGGGALGFPSGRGGSHRANPRWVWAPHP